MLYPLSYEGGEPDEHGETPVLARVSVSGGAVHPVGRRARSSAVLQLRLSV